MLARRTCRQARGGDFLLLAVAALVLALFVAPGAALAAESEPMYRLYNRYTGEHFYTASAYERDSLDKVGWDYEGVGWTAPSTSKTPVYRLYNSHVQGGDHHYTTSTVERDSLRKAGWSYEGVGWYSDDAKGVPLYRQYNPYAATGTHNYTSSAAERSNLISVGWRDEGIAWYGVKASNGSGSGGSSSGGSQGSGSGTSQQPTTTKFTVTFDTQGGPSVPSQSVTKGGTARRPSSPYRSGYTFAGWYTSPNGSSLYDFSTPVTKNTTLYARWTVYVYFDTGYGASRVPAQKVFVGERVAKPSDPVDQTWNNEFDCWCTDEAQTKPFNFSTPITKSITLYARWTVFVPVNVSTGVRGVTMNAFWAPVGETIDLPDPPKNPDYEFLGWYYYPSSGGSAVRADENAMVTDDWNGRTIYARWAWKQHYQYEAYYLDDRGNTWYTGTSRTMYVKTNNPAAYTIGIRDATPQGGDFAQVALQMNSFDDVSPLAWDSNCLKVPGGYLVSFIYEGDQRGSTSFQIVEYADPEGDVYDSSLAVDSVAARTVNVNVIDGDAAKQQWIDETIERYTTDSMTPPQKMNAICAGILSDFTYMTTIEGEDGYCSLVTDPDSPFWVTHRWDSYISPGMLCEIAETIGGFTDIKNHYGDYPVGSPEWVSGHYLASMTYNGEEYWYEACPLSDTNEISRDDIEMVDFTDTSSMQPA